jgi:hypothetical protein
VIVAPNAGLVSDTVFERARSAGNGVFVAVAELVTVAVVVEVLDVAVTLGVLVRVAVFEALGVVVAGLGHVGKKGSTVAQATTCASATLAFPPMLKLASTPSTARAGITRNRKSKRERIQPPLN